MQRGLDIREGPDREVFVANITEVYNSFRNNDEWLHVKRSYKISDAFFLYRNNLTHWTSLMTYLGKLKR